MDGEQLITADEAKAGIEKAIPGAKVEACVPYKGGYLARAVLPSAEEANWDPFFIVNANTGEIQEFSVMTDGDPLEIAEAFEQGDK